jgi:hypothetical protein
MKPDLYTKAVLTVIAFMLVMIGCRQYVSPVTAVHAEGPFAGVQTTGSLDFFDTRTGEVYSYSGRTNDGKSVPLLVKFRVTKLGEPVVVEYEAKQKY